MLYQLKYIFFTNLTLPCVSARMISRHKCKMFALKKYIILYRVPSIILWWASCTLIHEVTMWEQALKRPCRIHVFVTACHPGYKLRYIAGFGLVEMAISTNPKPTIYRNLYQNTGPGHFPSTPRVWHHTAQYKTGRGVITCRKAITSYYTRWQAITTSVISSTIPNHLNHCICHSGLGKHVMLAHPICLIMGQHQTYNGPTSSGIGTLSTDNFAWVCN